MINQIKWKINKTIIVKQNINIYVIAIYNVEDIF